MKLKDELLNNSIYIKNFENDGMLYDYIYFIQQRKKHSSGYNFIHIYGERKGKYYILSRCSDVIDFNKILCNLEWFNSIDIPEYNVFRMFTSNNYKFKCDYLHCSSFSIEIVREEINGNSNNKI